MDKEKLIKCFSCNTLKVVTNRIDVDFKGKKGHLMVDGQELEGIASFLIKYEAGKAPVLTVEFDNKEKKDFFKST